MGKVCNGIVVVDKPVDITSAKVVAIVKRVFGARKAGHAGTLDPFATGVLVCALNRATRLSRFFLHGDKTYRGRMVLGVETDTQDATGAVTRVERLPALSKSAIEEAFRRFEGEIEQAPPAYSALKHEGTPLYKFARRGTPIQKAPRRVTIRRLEIFEVRLPEIGFEVTCSGGTYVRTLCADIGRALGCGGHLKALRRIESSGFNIAEAVSLEQLEAMADSERLRTVPIPMAEALRHLPAVAAEAELAKKIRYGRKIAADDLPEAQRAPGPLKVTDHNGRLLAVIEGSRPDGGYRYCVNLQ